MQAELGRALLEMQSPHVSMFTLFSSSSGLHYFDVVSQQLLFHLAFLLNSVNAWQGIFHKKDVVVYPDPFKWSKSFGVCEKNSVFGFQ